MKSDILFSILIPTYNTYDYIEQCINSLERQNYNNYEIIICDDGSSDGTIQLLEKLTKKYDNIHIYLNEHNGLAYERNNGIELAKGEYIFFCDSDDYVSDNFFEVLTRKLKNEHPDILFFNYNIIINDKIDSTIKKETSLNKYDYFYRNSCVWSCVYKRSLFLDNDISFPVGLYHQDDAVYFKLIDKADDVKSVDGALYNYRKFRIGSSMSSKSEKYYNDILTVAEMNLQYFSTQDKEAFNCLGDVYIGKLFDYLLFNIAHSSIKTANLYYQKVIALLNKYVDEWQKNKYFNDASVSILTRIIRKTLKNETFVRCYNTNFFKKILKKKMENYQ